ncbi:MAG TPA: universal stress protein [Planctomycetota bacterium]|nr:universal stress protein [Planctomycetota bacterium]
MGERILIPLDGSETAEAILPQVQRFLRRHAAEVVLLQAVGGIAPDFHFAVPGQHEEVNAYIRKRTFELVNDGITARGLVREGRAAELILEAAESERATLIAMSTHGRTGLGRFVFGSVAEKVLRASPVPVLMVRSFPHGGPSRGRIEELPFRNFLVPLDGSDASASSIPLILRWARPLDAHVTLLHVVEPGPLAPHWPAPGAAVRETQKALTEACIPNVLEELQGDPASEILRWSEEHETDLIVMSSHGRSGPTRWILGSVTEKVLRAATVPLVVAHRSPARREEIAIRPEISAILPPA